MKGAARISVRAGYIAASDKASRRTARRLLALQRRGASSSPPAVRSGKRSK